MATVCGGGGVCASGSVARLVLSAIVKVCGGSNRRLAGVGGSSNGSPEVESAMTEWTTV